MTMPKTYKGVMNSLLMKSVNKTEDLLTTFEALISQYGIILDIDRDMDSIPAWSVVSLDIEHDEDGNMVGIGICHGNSCLYFTALSVSLIHYLCGVAFVAHNGISDMECLRQWGIPVRDEQLVWDTMLCGHVIDSSLKSYGLKAMAERELGIIYPSYDDIVGKKTLKQKQERVTLDRQPSRLVALYNAMDTYVTYKLWQEQQKGYIQCNLFASLEKPVSLILQKMSNRGIRVDLHYLEGLKTSLEAQQIPIKAEITNELGPINLNSPRQLLEALNAKGIAPAYKGKPSTDKRALEPYRTVPLVAKLFAYSELETLLSNFVNPYLERGQSIIRPFYNQCGTRTGRLSCSNPNLLQIPRRTDNGKLVRRMFIPRDGMLMGDCDFGQIEPRVLAHLSKDPVLCKLFNDGTDFHQFTAERLGISRDRAKILNLSVGYRATFKSVSAQLQCTDREAQNEIDKWWSLFPSLRRWQDDLLYEANRSGYCTTLLGRRIKVDNLSNGNKWQREAAQRQLINNITQGSAAEIMKLAMIKCDKDLPNLGLLVQVYDELVFEEEESYMEDTMALVLSCMENAIKLDVPLTVDCGIGPNWAMAKI